MSKIIQFDADNISKRNESMTKKNASKLLEILSILKA